MAGATAGTGCEFTGSDFGFGGVVAGGTIEFDGACIVVTGAAEEGGWLDEWCMTMRAAVRIRASSKRTITAGRTERRASKDDCEFGRICLGAAARFGFRRVAMSAMLQRSCGSRRRQWRAISANSDGRPEGSAGSAWVVRSQEARRWVSASDRGMARDPTSPAGEIRPPAASGGS